MIAEREALGQRRIFSLGGSTTGATKETACLTCQQQNHVHKELTLTKDRAQSMIVGIEQMLWALMGHLK